jgi:hypothetical protein
MLKYSENTAKQFTKNVSYNLTYFLLILSYTTGSWLIKFKKFGV